MAINSEEKNDNKDQPSWKVNSVAKCIQILQKFTVEKPEWQLTQLSKELSIPKSTLLNMLKTLQMYGYITRLNNQNYSLGIELLALSYNVYGSLPIIQSATPLMEDIQEKTGKIVYFTIPLKGKCFYLEGVYPGKRNITYSVTGRKLLMHCTGCGKAMLSGMKDEDIDKIISAYGLPKYTSTTITEPNNLKKEIQKIRERGYAIDLGEETPGVKCVAVPIKNRDRLLGAFSISGSTMTMHDDILPGYAEMLTEASYLLSTKGDLFPPCQPLP